MAPVSPLGQRAGPISARVNNSARRPPVIPRKDFRSSFGWRWIVRGGVSEEIRCGIRERTYCCINNNRLKFPKLTAAR